MFRALLSRGQSLAATQRLFSGNQKFLLMGSGKDRLGIVKDVTGVIFSLNGNVLDSRMTKLAGEFGLMMLVSIPSDDTEATKRQIETRTQAYGFQVSTKEVTDIASAFKVEDHYTCTIELTGADHPGILHHLTHFLTYVGINIATMHTQHELAPMGGSVLFKLQAVVNVPSLVNFDNLSAKVAEIETKEGVMISLKRLTDDKKV